MQWLAQSLKRAGAKFFKCFKIGLEPLCVVTSLYPLPLLYFFSLYEVLIKEKGHKNDLLKGTSSSAFQKCKWGQEHYDSLGRSSEIVLKTHLCTTISWERRMQYPCIADPNPRASNPFYNCNVNLK